MESGTGEHPWLYTFEHACLEFPFGVDRQVEEIMKKRIKQVPIEYPWWQLSLVSLSFVYFIPNELDGHSFHPPPQSRGLILTSIHLRDYHL